MHNRISTASSLPYGADLPDRNPPDGNPPGQQPPGQRPPTPRQRPHQWTETPWTETPWTENPPPVGIQTIVKLRLLTVKIRDLTIDRTQITCLAVSHSNH